MGSLLAKVAQKYKIIVYNPKNWDKDAAFGLMLLQFSIIGYR